MSTRIVLRLLTAVAFLVPVPAPAAQLRPRLVVLTDIGGDPDDQQSMIRLMLYSNEFEIEGLIASASGTPGELKEAVVRPDLIRQIVEAYGRVQPNLATHAEGFPPAGELLGRIKSGNPHRGLDYIGPGQDTEGSDWLIRCADASDQPLCITIWGGQTDLAQALWRVRRDRSPDELKIFLQKLRIYDISDQDRIQPWIFENFPDLFYMLAKAPAGRDKREGAYRGMYLGGDESSTSLAWLDEHVRKKHGPLGELYPPRTWTEPNPHGALKEGDTPSWFFFRPSPLSDPEHPDWGGWGGRFRRSERGLWRDVPDLVNGQPDPRASVWRWRPIFQREFQARLDWCVTERKKANHAPVIVIDGMRLARPLVRTAKAGSTLRFDASQSTDPDGHKLSFHWWLYHDAGNMSGAALRVTTAAVGLDVPLAARGQTAHVIVEATDDGNPPLTTCARIVVTAE
jgi:hypothetical protein